MTVVPLGRGAYRRSYSGAPEIQLLNRWLEANPANLKEGVSVIARPGTTLFQTFNQGSFDGYRSMRGNYTLSGLFDNSLFVICGETLYRINEDETSTPITGIISGLGHPEVTWQRGLDYERLWIADGTLLQYYSGETSANGTIDKIGAIVDGVDKLNIAGVYYVWGTVFNGTDDGSLANPFVVDPLADPLGQLEKAINATGVAGTDYSATLGGPNTYVSADLQTINELDVTARVQGTSGNSLPLVVIAGTGLDVSGTGFLQNGGIHALQGCTVPDGKTVGTLAQVDSYVLVGINNSQQFYWINPGEVVIDPLNFASKESAPDPITQIRTVGDQVLISGERSTENWYATGNDLAPFAPIEGRAYARGAIPGTSVVIDDSAFLVGDDGKVYRIGVGGMTVVSNPSIEERIRMQQRREQGLVD